jgi:hypothetical protein
MEYSGAFFGDFYSCDFPGEQSWDEDYIIIVPAERKAAVDKFLRFE